MQDLDPKAYVLKRDEEESGRLNRQHAVFASAAGYLIHPRIQATLHKDHAVRVADVATGTGAWALALESSTPPNWEIQGLDISADQFPTTKTSRCKFDILDILKPVPFEVHGKYDMVHIRLLCGALTTQDWSIVAANAFRMLKPGGWVQWHEMAPTTVRILPNSPEASTKCSEKFIRISTSGYQRIGRFMEEDMDLMIPRVESAGFVDCNLHCPSSDRMPEMRREASITISAGVATALELLAMRDPKIAAVTVEQARDLSKKAFEELEDDKAYWRWDMYIATARKPVTE